MQKKYLILVIVTFIGLLSFISKDKQLKNSKIKRANKIYAQNCASCHGELMQAFVDRKWKYGTTKEKIFTSISSGSPDFGMPAYKESISKKDIETIAILMEDYYKHVDEYQVKPKPQTNIYTSDGVSVRLDTIAKDLSIPWGFAQLPTGEYLICDRNGKLYFIDNNRIKTVIKNTPKVLAEGQGGLLDIELHPDFKNNGWIYISYSKPKEEAGLVLGTTAIVRGKITNGEFTNQQEIFEAQPYVRTKHHYGSKLIFDDKNYLFFSVGERGREKEFPQSTENDNGKIHRLHDDGRIPTDNPFVNKAGSRGSIYSFGHRNPQGLVYNASTGVIWETEHGPRGGDELNIIRKGANYGWPVISYGINYDGKPITNISKKDGLEQPEIYWIPSIAPCGMTIVNSNKYSGWNGNIMVASLRFNYLNRCIIENNKIVKQEKILTNIGRMRNVEMGTDGFLYVGLENPGMVLKLIPQ